MSLQHTKSMRAFPLMRGPSPLTPVFILEPSTFTDLLREPLLAPLGLRSFHHSCKSHWTCLKLTGNPLQPAGKLSSSRYLAILMGPQDQGAAENRKALQVALGMPTRLGKAANGNPGSGAVSPSTVMSGACCLYILQME